MMYKRRTEEIEGFKWTGTEEQLTEYGWFLKAFEDGIVRFNNIGTAEAELIIKSQDETKIVYTGAHIVQDIDGKILACGPNLFEKIYEEVKDYTIEEIRELDTIQKREKLNTVYSIDKKGAGGANHKYVICEKNSLEYALGQPILGKKYGEIQFQNGARKLDDSIHGIIDSDLLEIVRDRLISFQAGPFSSEDNANTLAAVESALTYLNKRVEDRINRNVLGLNEK